MTGTARRWVPRDQPQILAFVSVVGGAPAQFVGQ
jgi:hypothetical protein